MIISEKYFNSEGSRACATEERYLQDPSTTGEMTCIRRFHGSGFSNYDAFPRMFRNVVWFDGCSENWRSSYSKIKPIYVSETLVNL